MTATSDLFAAASCSTISSDDGKPSGGSPLSIRCRSSCMRSAVTPSNVTTRATVMGPSPGRYRATLLLYPTKTRTYACALPLSPLASSSNRYAPLARCFGTVTRIVLEPAGSVPSRSRFTTPPRPGSKRARTTAEEESSIRSRSTQPRMQLTLPGRTRTASGADFADSRLTDRLLCRSTRAGAAGSCFVTSIGTDANAATSRFSVRPRAAAALCACAQSRPIVFGTPTSPGDIPPTFPARSTATTENVRASLASNAPIFTSSSVPPRFFHGAPSTNTTYFAIVSPGASQRRVSPSPAICPLKCSGFPGAMLSRCKTCVGDQADVFPAESCERTCQYRRPPPGCPAGDQVVSAPLINVSEVPLRTTPRHMPSEQIRNSRLPVPANEGLLKVAFSWMCDTHAPSAGE